MNALNLSLFDTSFLASGEQTATVRPNTLTRQVRTRTALPAALWRQTLAAHEPAAGHRWTRRVYFVLLGALSAASVIQAGLTLCHCVLGHDGLNAAVQHLMAR